MLLFGQDRLQHFRDAWIQVARFTGVNKTSIFDTREITCYPVQAIDEALDFVKKHAMRSLIMPSVVSHLQKKLSAKNRSLSQHEESWSIPLIAVREAIINAVVHADYTQQGSPIRLSIFDDRIEIENPGLIPFNLTLEDLYRGISKLRNPVIGRVFHGLKLIERWGSGIGKILEACEDAGLKKPIFEEVGLHFRVTIFSQPERAAKVDDLDQSILELLMKNEGLSTQQIASRIALSPRATRSRLIKLIDRGLVVEIGKNPKDPGRKYFLAQ